jgi:hypothetical protein
MLIPAEVKINKVGTAELTQNGNKLQLKVNSPSNITLKTWSTQESHDDDAPNGGTTLLGFEVKISANSRNSLEVLLIPEENKVISDTKTLQLKDWK